MKRAAPLAKVPDLTALALPQSEPIAEFNARALAELADLPEVIVDSAEAYTVADAYLSDVKRQIREWTEKRQEAARPFKTVSDWIEGAVRPGLQALAKVEAEVKARMGAYLFERAAAERAAREAAQKALAAGDDDALAESLTQSLALAEKPESNAVARWEWRVKRINESLLTDDYWIVDRARIDAELKAHKGEDPPVIAGVVPERVPLIAGKVK